VLDKFNTTLRGVPDRLHRTWHDVAAATRRLIRDDKFRIGHISERARADIDVIRHRVNSRFGKRQRHLVVALAAVVGLSLAAVAANAAVTVDEQPAAAANHGAAEQSATEQERQAAADRADRAAREAPAESEPAAEPEESPESEADSGRGSAAEESPTPEPEPEPEPTPEPKPDWVHPMPGAATTSCFGPRWGALHAGVDLAAPHGTPMLAVGAGTVTHAGWVFGGYGISVVIDHGDGHYTHYAHASEARVSPGDRVEAGDVIALEGSTGNSTGPHLHFEVHKGSLWNQVEPTQWMSNRGVHIGGC
jgi:murein DD-endopeptidase MepM/ murein hydrolase activator NlpD